MRCKYQCAKGVKEMEKPKVTKLDVEIEQEFIRIVQIEDDFGTKYSLYVAVEVEKGKDPYMFVAGFRKFKDLLNFMQDGDLI
jgi:hypothetical protein